MNFNVMKTAVEKNCIFRLFFTTVSGTRLLFVYKTEGIHNGPRSTPFESYVVPRPPPLPWIAASQRAPPSTVQTELLLKATRGQSQEVLADQGLF